MGLALKTSSPWQLRPLLHAHLCSSLPSAGTSQLPGVPRVSNPAGLQCHPWLDQRSAALPSSSYQLLSNPIPSWGGQGTPMASFSSVPKGPDSRGREKARPVPCSSIPSCVRCQDGFSRGRILLLTPAWAQCHAPTAAPSCWVPGWKTILRGCEETSCRNHAERERAQRKIRARKSDWQIALSPGARLPVCSAALVAQKTSLPGRAKPVPRLAQGEPSAPAPCPRARRTPSPPSFALSCFAARCARLPSPRLLP